MAILGVPSIPGGVTHQGIPWRALGQPGLASLAVMSNATAIVMGFNQLGQAIALEIPEHGGVVTSYPKAHSMCMCVKEER